MSSQHWGCRGQGRWQRGQGQSCLDPGLLHRRVGATLGQAGGHHPFPAPVAAGACAGISMTPAAAPGHGDHSGKCRLEWGVLNPHLTVAPAQTHSSILLTGSRKARPPLASISHAPMDAQRRHGGGYSTPPPSSASPILLHQLSPGCPTPARSHLQDPATAVHSCVPAPAQQLPA